jgi:hypothetical protein
LQSLSQLIGVDFVEPVVQQHCAIDINKPQNLARQVWIDRTDYRAIKGNGGDVASRVETVWRIDSTLTRGPCAALPRGEIKMVWLMPVTLAR